MCNSTGTNNHNREFLTFFRLAVFICAERGDRVRSINHSFYTSRRWCEVAEAFRKYSGGVCQRCKAKGIYKPADIVHHKTHLNAENVKNPAIAYGFDNLECLCQDCHNIEHHGKKKERRRYVIDQNGNILI